VDYDGFEADYAGPTCYFKSIRAAFQNRTIRRPSACEQVCDCPYSALKPEAVTIGPQ
jgi:hypothetical protein